MHILFINSVFPQPSQTFVLDQIRFARQEGLKVTIFAKRFNRRLAAERTPDVFEIMVHDRPRSAKMLARLAGGAVRMPDSFAIGAAMAVRAS